MSRLESLWAKTEKLSTFDLLKFLIKKQFPRKTAVTASLRARSIVVLKMVADIDPATPILFCHAAQLYPESRQYRADLVARLGLTDVRDEDSRVANLQQCKPMPRDRDHCERLWADDRIGGGRVFELIHLNESLSDFDCWISAVYHGKEQAGLRHRVDLDGRLVRVNPLLGWSDDDVRRFMRANELPYHPHAIHIETERLSEPRETPPSYSY